MKKRIIVVMFFMFLAAGSLLAQDEGGLNRMYYGESIMEKKLAEIPGYDTEFWWARDSLFYIMPGNPCPVFIAPWVDSSVVRKTGHGWEVCYFLGGDSVGTSSVAIRESFPGFWDEHVDITTDMGYAYLYEIRLAFMERELPIMIEEVKQVCLTIDKIKAKKVEIQIKKNRAEKELAIKKKNTDYNIFNKYLVPAY